MGVYRESEWLDPRIEIRVSAIQGRGMHALASITAGEPLIIWGGVVFTSDDIEAGKVALGSTVAIGEGVYLGATVGQYDRENDDRGDFINHSCDPNVWMGDEVTSIARRDIALGDELTMDYAMIVEHDDWVHPWECRCGSPLCRGRITGSDWKLGDLSDRYAGRFSPFINRRIEAAGLGVRIRRAQQADAGEVAALHIRAWQWAYRGQLPDAFLDGLANAVDMRTGQWASSIGQTDQRVWRANAATGIVGFAHTWNSHDDDRERHTGEVGAIYLDADWVGIGVGRLLFTQAVEDLRLRGYRTVTLWVLDSNERARHFYEAAGFQADGATKVEARPGFELREIRYSRDF